MHRSIGEERTQCHKRRRGPSVCEVVCLLSERDAEQREDTKQSRFARDRKVRQRDARQITLDHQQHTDGRDLDGFVAAEHQPKLVLVVYSAADDHVQRGL